MSAKAARMLRTLAWRSVGLVCIFLLVPGDVLFYAQQQPTTQQQPGQPADQQASTPKIPPDQLDSLVAPIALYPDPLLAQTLAASTYPLEIVQLQQWLEKNPGLKDQALAAAVAKQPWDPSVQALAPMPEVVKRLADDIQWTTDLGNAFLAQQSDVMAAVQRMRQKAQSAGNLKSSPQQTVETKVIDGQNTIILQPASTQVVYVPSYNPVVVYGPPIYPYPPIYYPPPGYYAAGLAIAFGAGVAMGAFWGGGGWGWGCGWGSHTNIYINNNNTFIRNSTNINNINRGNRPSQLPSGNSNWQHNPQHRGGAPYSNSATANRYGGTTRGDSLATRQAAARQQINREGGNLPSNRAGYGGSSNRPSSTGGGEGFNNRAAGGGGFNGQGGGGGADRIGSRDVSRNPGGNRDAFGGGSREFNGSSARASGARGASSFGGGGFRGGGFHGGGGRRW